MGKHLIKNWTMKHDTVVHLHCAGFPNKKIAEVVGYTPVRVSQILSTDQAKLAIRAVQATFRERIGEEITDELLALASLGVERLKETMDEDMVPGTDPKKHQDKVSLEIIKGLGYLPGRFANDDDGQNRPPLNEKLAERLIDALEASNKVDEYHGTVIEGEVVYDDE